MPNYEYAVYVLTGLFCVLTLLVAACIILLVKCYNRLETIFEAVGANVSLVQDVFKDLRLVSIDVEKMHEKIGDIRNDLNVCLDKLDPPRNNACREPGEAVVLEERDVEEYSGDKFINDFLAGKYEGHRQCQDDGELDIVMISKEEYMFGNTQEYSKFKLWYNPEGNTLRYTKTIFDFADFNAANASTFLGDGLWYFGVNSGLEPNIIYIRNHRLKADFMIEKPKEKMSDGVGDQEN